jgi:FlaA1/EpsC-like NDP-sugar epimerase
MNIHELLGRSDHLFKTDLVLHTEILNSLVQSSRFLIVGGAGSIGQAVTREIFTRNPAKLHVVDINENNMVELVREIRSTLGYSTSDFRTFAVDCGSREFEALTAAEGPYDYVLNLSALKHVRSEKDPYTLMRMIEVNVFNTLKSLSIARGGGARKYFCVSTDKAANPVNLMGASKRIMELFLLRESITQTISMARFANVAFSDGSLLYGFNQRFAKRQPISAPNDVRRYFITPQESGELCLLSCLLGENRDIFFPKLSEAHHLTTFSDIAVRYLNGLGYDAFECDSEDEARGRAQELISAKKWPCYFFKSDTTGEKEFEEFFTPAEDLDMERFSSVGVIRNAAIYDPKALDRFEDGVRMLRDSGRWTKPQLIELVFEILPGFSHLETGKYLDQRM